MSLLSRPIVYISVLIGPFSVTKKSSCTGLTSVVFHCISHSSVVIIVC